MVAWQSMVRYWMPKTPHLLESFTSLSKAHCDYKALDSKQTSDTFSNHSISSSTLPAPTMVEMHVPVALKNIIFLMMM